MGSKLNHFTRAWLRQHGRGETLLAKAVEQFLDAQAERVAEAVGGYTNPTPDLAAKLIDASAENATLLQSIHPKLFSLMGLGAEMELSAAETAKSFELPAGILNVFKLPAKVLGAIRHALDVLELQPYWLRIQRETEVRLARVIEAGIDDGDSLRGIVKRVREGLGGQHAKERAQKIARTESTGCLNAGHYEARQSLIEDGLITGSEWLSLEGARETHAALDGEIVKAGELFNVGGHRAPHPAHYSLPAQERVNCRCTTVAAATWADE